MKTPREVLADAQEQLGRESAALQKIVEENENLQTENKQLSEECCRRARHERELEAAASPGDKQWIEKLANWIQNERPDRLIGAHPVTDAINTMHMDGLRIKQFKRTIEGMEVARAAVERAYLETQKELDRTREELSKEKKAYLPVVLPRLLTHAVPNTYHQVNVEADQLREKLADARHRADWWERYSHSRQKFITEMSNIIGTLRAELRALRDGANRALGPDGVHTAGIPCTGPAAENGECDAPRH